MNRKNEILQHFSRNLQQKNDQKSISLSFNQKQTFSTTKKILCIKNHAKEHSHGYGQRLHQSSFFVGKILQLIAHQPNPKTTQYMP